MSAAEEQGARAHSAALEAWYRSERRYYDEGRRRAEQRIGQMVSGGATGGLVLSVSLVGGLSSTPGHGLLGLLLASWGSLLGALVCSLWSLRKSAEAHLEVVERLDAAYRNSSLADYEARSVKADGATKRLNAWAVVLLGVGIVGLACFSASVLW